MSACHVCGATPAGRFGNKARKIFTDRYTPDGADRDQPVQACRFHLSRKGADENEVNPKRLQPWEAG